MRTVEDLEGDGTVHEPEVVRDTALVRSPSVPTTVDELAALQEEGKEIVEARVEILRTLRLASIRATRETDWVLYRTKEGNITAYLEDKGCQRVAPLWGIEVTPTSTFEKLEAGDDFAYSIEGDGYCAITKQRAIAIQGLRYSTDDFVNQGSPMPPIMKEMRVRQAARANLDGNIVRRLAGLKSISLEEIAEAWKGTGKDPMKCTKGRGFGTQREREGAQTREGDAPHSTECPMCPKCGAKMYFREAGKRQDGNPYAAFWGCSNYKKTGCKGSVQDSDWLKHLEQMRTQQAQQPATEDRQPGMEG